MRSRHCLRAAFVALWVASVGASGCRATAGGAYVGTPPRAGSGSPPGADDVIRVTLSVDDEATGELVESALARSTTPIEVKRLSESQIEAERSTCRAPECRGPRGPVCRLARRHGADYHLTAAMSARYDDDFVCRRYKLNLSKNDECAEYETKNRRTRASFRLTVVDTADCNEIPALGKSIERRFPGARERSEPEARAHLAQAVPQLLAPLFPAQRTVRGSRATEPGRLYAVFRGRRYRGLVRAADQGRLTRLSCCFEPRPDDTLVERGRYWLLDGLIGGTALQLQTGAGRELLLGGGYHLRAHPVDGGLHVGLALEAAGRSGLHAAVATAEAGWTFRPAPSIELSPLVGIGVGRVSRDEGEGAMPDEGRAPHAAFLLRATLARRLWLASFDAGWSVSGTYQRELELGGPLVRVVLGLRL